MVRVRIPQFTDLKPAAILYHSKPMLFNGGTQTLFPSIYK